MPTGIWYVARWSSGLRLRPLTPATRVRISYGSPFIEYLLIKQHILFYIRKERKLCPQVGVDYGEGPPVPIPNTEVKLISVEDTWRAAARENRTVPTYIFLYSSVGRACGC